jgi:hypothetical protein
VVIHSSLEQHFFFLAPSSLHPFFLGSGSFIGNEMHTAICQGAVHFTTNLKIGLTRGGINDHVW